jgi:hypothetical protein
MCGSEYTLVCANPRAIQFGKMLRHRMDTCTPVNVARTTRSEKRLGTCSRKIVQINDYLMTKTTCCAWWHCDGLVVVHHTVDRQNHSSDDQGPGWDWQCMKLGSSQSFDMRTRRGAIFLMTWCTSWLVQVDVALVANVARSAHTGHSISCVLAKCCRFVSLVLQGHWISNAFASYKGCESHFPGVCDASQPHCVSKFRCLTSMPACP